MIENTAFSDTIALTHIKTLPDTILSDDRRYLANETKRYCLCLTPATQRRSPLGLSALRDCATNLPGR